MRSALGRRQRPGRPADPIEDDGPSTGARPSQPASGAGQVFLLMPDEFEEESPPAPAATRTAGGSGRAVRLAAYGAAGLLAAAGLVRLGSLFASRSSGAVTAAASAAPSVSPQVRVDRVADTLALATSAFDLRARLFQTHQMQCPDLARGLIVVEERWAEYNAARAVIGAAADSAHTALDRSLYAGVDATERQFEVSKCPRP